MSEFLEKKDYYLLIDRLRLENDPVERFGLIQILDKKFSESNSNFRYSLLKYLNILISEDEYKFCRVVDLNPQMSFDQIANGAYPYQDYLQIREDIKLLAGGLPVPTDPVDEQEKIKDFEPGRFNGLTRKLFLYLIENYKKEGKVKYTNIFYFLKELASNKPDLLFNFTQKKFTTFIENEFGEKITKYKKAEFGYEDKENPVLRNCTNIFFESLQEPK